jgi:hypothetical protein
MIAHKKTLIRQAGSAWALIDSLPLVVNYNEYSSMLLNVQYLLPLKNDLLTKLVTSLSKIRLVTCLGANRQTLEFMVKTIKLPGFLT